jgi:hypothetical protein
MHCRSTALRRCRFEQILSIEAWWQLWGLFDGLDGPFRLAEASVEASQAVIAAISGLMPTMLMTRVRL